MNRKWLFSGCIRSSCALLACIKSGCIQPGCVQPGCVQPGCVQLGCTRSSRYPFLVALLLTLLSATVSADTEFAVENYKGKIVYVDFWASWCIPCRASFPFMQEMSEKYGESLVIVAINVDESRADAEQFLEQFSINFDIVYDPKGALAESFEVKGMPTSYLYDREGNLLGSHIGFRKKDIGKLEEAIANAANTAGVER